MEMILPSGTYSEFRNENSIDMIDEWEKKSLLILIPSQYDRFVVQCSKTAWHVSEQEQSHRQISLPSRNKRGGRVIIPGHPAK